MTKPHNASASHSAKLQRLFLASIRAFELDGVRITSHLRLGAPWVISGWKTPLQVVHD